MNCDMSIVVAGPDERGWVKRKCARDCGKTTDWTPHQPDRIQFACLAWPRRWEIGTWLALFFSAIGISKRRWAWVQWKLGLVEVPAASCGKCTARQKWLNTLGGRLVTLAEGGKWYGRLLAWLLVTRSKPTEPPSP